MDTDKNTMEVRKGGYTEKISIIKFDPDSFVHFCSGRAAHEKNSLRAINPLLAREWHPIKNGFLTPNDVTAGSHKKVWWICSKGHEWRAIVKNRNNGSRYPYLCRKV